MKLGLLLIVGELLLHFTRSSGSFLLLEVAYLDVGVFKFEETQLNFLRAILIYFLLVRHVMVIRVISCLEDRIVFRRQAVAGDSLDGKALNYIGLNYE